MTKTFRFLFLAVTLLIPLISLQAQTPPDVAWVNDGSGVDIDFWTSQTNFQGNCAPVAFTPGAVTTRYNWAITISSVSPDGPIAGGSGYTSGTSFSVSGLSMTEGISHWLWVRAEQDMGGGFNTSTFVPSDGFVVDTIAPTVSMDALPAIQTDTGFTISWQGTDVTSGIAEYDVQRKENQGPWVTWFAGTSATSSNFIGTSGSTYAFQVRARDRAGNQSAYSAQVSTQINAMSAYLDVNADPSFLAFSSVETSLPIELNVMGMGSGSFTLTSLSESRSYPGWPVENLPDQFLTGSLVPGVMEDILRDVTLSAAQRAKALSSQADGSFTITYTVRGISGDGQSVAGQVDVQVSVGTGPASSLIIGNLAVNLPLDPYFVGEQVSGEIVVVASGTGTVQGRVLVDGSQSWTANPTFTASITGTTTISIPHLLPTDISGSHEVIVELISPDTLSAQATYTVAESGASPFTPARIILIPQVAELTDLDGTAVAQAGLGYQDFTFTGTGDLQLLSVGPFTVPTASATGLIIRYYDGDPVPHLIGGSVEAAALPGNPVSLFDLAGGYLRVRQVMFQAGTDPSDPQDHLDIDAALTWSQGGGELFLAEGIPVGTTGLEGADISFSPGEKEFAVFGKKFHIEDFDGQPALSIVPEAGRVGFVMAGRLSWQVKSGSSLPSDQVITSFQGLSLYSDDTVEGTFPVSAYGVMGGKMPITEVEVRLETGVPVCEVRGRVSNLPSPLDAVSENFSIVFDINGTAVSQSAGLNEWQGGTRGLQGDGSDPTEWMHQAATVDLTALTPSLHFAENGVFYTDQSLVRLAVDLYLNLRSSGGVLPPEQSRISLGTMDGQGTIQSAVEIGADGSISWPTPETGSAFDDTRYDVTSVLTLALEHLEIDTTDGFRFRTAGEIVVDFPGVDGGAAFQDLRLSLDGDLTKGAAEQIEGQFDMLDVIRIFVGDIGWGGEDVLTFSTDSSDGQSQGGASDLKSVAVEKWLRLEGAEIQLGDTGVKGESLMGGTFDALTIYEPVDGNTSFVLKNVEANLYYVKLMQTDIEYLSTYLNLSGKVKIIPNDIIATVVGTAGTREGKPSFGLFVAAANLQMQVYPSVYLDEIGGGFFLNPDTEILDRVHTLAGFGTSGPTLVDSVDNLFPPGANEPGSFALLLMGGMYVVDKKLVQGRALFQLTENNFSLDAEVSCLKKVLQGEAHLAIGWDPGYAFGLVDVELDVLKILQGDGELQFFIFDSDTWGIAGGYNISLLWSVEASGEIFLGPPGFLLTTENEVSVNLGIVSGGVSLEAMFWYHNRQDEEDSWGAYAQARIWGEILWGLLSGEASLEGALIGAPRFTIYTVGTLRVEICWIEVFSGSLWVAVGEDGIDGGKGRNSQYDQLIEDARNMADEMNQAMDDLLDEIDAARLAMLEMSETQRQAAGLALVERSGLVGGLVGLVFDYNELDYWGGENALPPQLGVIHQQIFGPGQDALEQARTELQSEQGRIDAALTALDEFENQVVALMAAYQHLLVDDLPSVRDLGGGGNPFQGMETAVLQVGENSMTLPVGFRINENKAESQADGLEQIRQEFSEYQEAFIARAGLIDATLQELDQILYAGTMSLSSLNETYASLLTRMSSYVERFVRFQGANGEYAEESLALFDTPGMVSTVQGLLLQETGQVTPGTLNSWNDDRQNLINALVLVGGAEAGTVDTSAGDSAITDIERFVGRGTELWYHVPRAGFEASRDQSPIRAAHAVDDFSGAQINFQNRWGTATDMSDTVFARKSDLYDVLWEIYDQLGRYGSGMIAVSGDGGATGFEDRVTDGLDFRGETQAGVIQSQITTLPQGAVPPQEPTVGPYNPVLPISQESTTINATPGFLLMTAPQDRLGIRIASAYLTPGLLTDLNILAKASPLRDSKYGKETLQKPLVEAKSAVSEQWVAIRPYFEAKREEIEPYLAIPSVTTFDGQVISSSESGAFLEASFTGSHPVAVAEYAYRLSSVPLEDWSPTLQPVSPNLMVLTPAGDWAYPWMSLGRIGEISRVFFSSADPLYLTMRIRGAGGKSIVFRSPFTVDIFNPATDSGPVTSTLDASDDSPPETPVVNLSSPYTASEEMIYATWSASDPQSGIGLYEYGVSRWTGSAGGFSTEGTGGTYIDTIGAQDPSALVGALEASIVSGGSQPPQEQEIFPDMLNWVSAAGRTESNIRGLELVDGERYVVHVRATNGLGLRRTGTSAPILVDLSPPSPPTITANQVSADGRPNSVSLSFTPGTDGESGIAGHRFAMGTSPGNDDLWPWTDAVANTATIVNLPVMNGTLVHVGVKARNGAGLIRDVSVPVTITYTDSTPPPAPHVSSMPRFFATQVSELTVSWDEVVDGQSGVIGYQYGVGTTTTDADILGWRSVVVEEAYLLSSNMAQQEGDDRGKGEGETGFIFGKTSIPSGKPRGAQIVETDFNETETQPPLPPGGPYYMLVRATNGKAMQTIGVSQPLVVDISPPEELNLTAEAEQPAGDTLQVRISARDSESGIAGYRFGLWKVDAVSQTTPTNPEGKVFLTSGITLDGTLRGTFEQTGKTYKPLSTGQAAGGTNLPGVVTQEAESQADNQGLPSDLPWNAQDLTEILPPWFESDWVDLQVPSEAVDINVVIGGFQGKGLSSGDRLIVRVWVMNGAGLFEQTGKVSITIIDPSKGRDPLGKSLLFAGVLK